MTVLGWLSGKRVRLSHGRSCHSNDHHKNGTNCLPALHACVRVGV